MNRICNCALVGLTLLLSGIAQAADFSLPDYQQFTLKNGLTVYLMEQSEVPLIDVSLVIKAGSIRDQKSAGLAKITADNLLLGTSSLNKSAFDQTLEFVGAQISAGASLEFSQLTLSMAAKDKEQLIPLVFEAVTSPAFEQTEFDKHKSRYKAGLAKRQESPNAMIKSYFNGMLYQGHPYANNQSGSISSVESIELEDIKAFHSRWYNPDNSALVIVGDFNLKSMKQTIKRVFGAWKGTTQVTKTPALTLKIEKPKVLLVNKADAKESTFVIGQKGIEYSHPDFIAVSVVNTILGARFTSWLNNELRVNSGLTYGARSRFDTMQLGGSFYMSSFTQSATTEEAIDLALKTYQRLWLQGVDKSTLESAKSYVKGQFPPNYETSSQLAGLLSRMFIYGFDESFINTFAANVNQLNEERVAKIIDDHFPKDNLQFVIIGNADEIRDKVKKYGELTETDIKSEFIPISIKK